jgi:hypothetical protein
MHQKRGIYKKTAECRCFMAQKVLAGVRPSCIILEWVCGGRIAAVDLSATASSVYGRQKKTKNRKIGFSRVPAQSFYCDFVCLFFGRPELPRGRLYAFFGVTAAE